MAVLKSNFIILITTLDVLILIDIPVPYKYILLYLRQIL